MSDLMSTKTLFRFASVMMIIMGCHNFGCDGVEAPGRMPDMSAGQDMGPPEPVLSCAPICAFLTGLCGQTTIVCDRCSRLAIDLRPIYEERTRSACGTAVNQMSCVGVLACLAHRHGLAAYGLAGQVTFNSTGQDPDLPSVMTNQAWAIVGSKGDATPSDLEVYFDVDGQVARIKVDDVAVSGVLGARAVADHPVEFGA